MENVQVVALCDVDAEKFDTSKSVQGNISTADDAIDLSGIQLFSDCDEMLTKIEPDAVSVALPTYMHAEYTVKALKAGCHVLCEKPMALNTQDCNAMIQAEKETGKILQIGHCIRFWPEYAKTKEIIDSKKYGKVLAASLRRLSHPATWAWDGWLTDSVRSGGAATDLHIHDTDFVLYLFGKPDSVSATAIKGPSKGFDHIATQYFYNDDKVVLSEGGWMMPGSFGFEMSFNILLENAAISYDCTRDKPFKVCPTQADAFTPDIAPGDGYSQEIDHFISNVAGAELAEITTSAQSRDSVEIILAELKSAETKSIVKL
jgi:predicted dehydrogenase